MELGFLLHALIPSWNSASNSFLSRNSCLFPWKRLLTLLSLIGLLGLGSKMNLVSPTLISDRGLELLSASFMFSFLVATALYIAGCRCRSQASSLKPHLTGDLLLDWYMGVQLSPHFMGIDLKFFFLRAGMMGWILINLSNLAKNVQIGTLSLSMILYQLFCLIHVMEVLYHEEQLTSKVGGFCITKWSYQEQQQ
ncbi:Sterol biosynthesis ERG24/DHCR-like - like 6 [Theobroma cacao]|nr:Sterol biosynthesis ERG24/DHCR-like - like 6 [Theobroma cacao]